MAVAIAVTADSTQHYFWKGIDGNLWQATIYPDGTKEGPYNRGFGPLGSAPTAGVDSKGATFVAWKGTDGDVWRGWFDETAMAWTASAVRSQWGPIG